MNEDQCCCPSAKVAIVNEFRGEAAQPCTAHPAPGLETVRSAPPSRNADLKAIIFAELDPDKKETQ